MSRILAIIVINGLQKLLKKMMEHLLRMFYYNTIILKKKNMKGKHCIWILK